MKSRYLALIACASAALLPAAPANAAIIFSFTPSANSIAVGEDVTIEAAISGLDSEILSGFDLNFVYNPGILDWRAITYFGGNLGNELGLTDNGLPNGNLGFINESTDSDDVLAASQANSFVLFSFTLRGVADGSTSFTLGADPDFDRNFVGRRFQTLGVEVGSVCIAVGTGSCDAQVPEPATLGLLGLGLAGLGLARRRRTVLV